MFAHGETVTRLRAGSSVNPYSEENESSDWENPESLDIDGCAFNPGGSTEPVEEGRSAVITRPTVYAPAAADVVADDRLVVRGRTYAVVGDPADWRSPFTGWRPGLVVELEAVEG